MTASPAIEYHERTKHRGDRYARSLGYLDWANQPDPFRRYEGARRVPLERPEPGDAPRLDALYEPDGRSAAALGRKSLSQLLFDTLALSAWKRFGSERWSLRCNPSSGNLHPTEGYVCLPEVADLSDSPGVYHYCSFDHALERRLELERSEWSALTGGLPRDAFLFGFSSIHWRESWKYGERAFRYCQHDVGHAIAQLAYAAAALGWHVRLLEAVGDDALAVLLGIARQQGPEAEHPDALLCVSASEGDPAISRFWTPAATLLRRIRSRKPRGRANTLSKTHHEWPVIDRVARDCRRSGGAGETFFDPRPRPVPPRLPLRTVSARRIFRSRRSAVAMDGTTGMERKSFVRVLQRSMPARAVPWAALPWRPSVHPLLLVHRVSDLAPGVYLLWRDRERAEPRDLLHADLAWERVAGLPDELPLFRLAAGDVRAFARSVNCHQAIASDGAFAVEMLAEFDDPLRRHGPWFYRRLHWEAGALGQLLYLEAEASGLRGTGIGCFFDDAIHDAVGITDRRLQMLYGFTVGAAVEDPRLSTEPAYAHLEGPLPGRA
jgi:SagB-type dehydrogenase family enzyme